MNEETRQDEGITPVAFRPLDPAAPAKSRKIKPLAIIVLMGLTISLIILGMLLTARTLIVETTPANADIDLDGMNFRLADNFLVWPGEYQVTVTAPGYKEAEETILISDAPNQKLAVELEKLPGHLEVITTPPGAEIQVSGKPMGRTPLTLGNLQPGEYQIALQKPRYELFETSVQIEGLDKTQQLQAALKPAWGELVMDSNPPGATVTVGGESRGITPLTTDLLSSGEEVTVKLAGFKQWRKNLSVPAGEKLDIPVIQLQPADGLVNLTSAPAGAGITVNGSFRGRTPTELELSPGKTHKIRLFLDGYQTVTRAVHMQSGVEQSLSLTLTPLQGNIRILTVPEDAEILVNGKPLGRSGQTLQLPARSHTLEVRRAGFASKKQTFTPQAGVEQVLQVKLLTEEQARWANTPRQITTANGETLKLFRPEQTFTMGASRREAGRRANEVLRDVRLERPFYLATMPVTNQQFKKFLREHTSSHVSGATLDMPAQPVVRISWEQAAMYCNWLSREEGLQPFYLVDNAGKAGSKITGINASGNGYRLPTEAEWAWAARFHKGGMLKYPWGENFPPLTISGNYADASSAKIVGKILPGYNDKYVASAPAGSFPANDKGLFDMGHNVLEWVHDYYGIAAGLSTRVETDPLGPEQGEFRVIRGASWRDADITTLRLSYRDYGLEGKDNIGFRIARYAN